MKWGERTEYNDVSRFCRLLKKELEGHSVNSVLTEGRPSGGYLKDDIILCFHRFSNMKNSEKRGASVTVPENSDSGVQYIAFRLLTSLCTDVGFRYGGVHTNTSRSPYKSLDMTGSPLTFLINLGFIDSFTDNSVLDTGSEELTKEFSRTLKEIIKERKNEAYPTI